MSKLIALLADFDLKTPALFMRTSNVEMVSLFSLAIALTSSILGSITDTFIFFSIAFYATGIPWVTLALGDLAVKLLIALVMLIPFRFLLKNIKDISEKSVEKLI